MTTILLRRGTAAQWTAANTVLGPGEAGFETDTGKLKIGNGSTAWGSLTYFVPGAAGSAAWGGITGTLSSQTDLQTALNAKQDTLVSGTNIKTVNGTSLVGSGDVVIGATVAWGGVTGTLSAQTDLQTALDGKVDENVAITGATKTKITYDAKGLVTSGADATTADIADSLNKRYVSDAEQTILGNTSGTNTGNETASTLGVTIEGTVSLTTNDTDLVTTVDSSVVKAVTWADIKAFFKTYFDTLYPSGSGTSTGTNNGDNAVNSLYSGLVSNATHTGDATGATALTVVKIQGKGFPTLGAGDDQKYPKYDNGTNAFVMTTIAGGGNVSNTGTPADNQIAVWTNSTTIEGDANLTFNTTTDLLTTGAVALAAGTATQAPIKLAAGTNLTTAEDGAIEMDADCFYGCTDAGNRGIIRIEHFIRADATRTFTSNTAQQAIFNAPANGTLTLETGAYLFEGLIAMTSMSATSGNGKFSLIGAGTATLGSILWQAYGNDNASQTTGAATGGMWSVIATQTAANIVTAATGTAMCFLVKGTFEVTGAGTIIPSFAQTTAAAAVVSIGSYFKCNRVGSTSVTSVGQWT